MCLNFLKYMLEKGMAGWLAENHEGCFLNNAFY